VGTEEPAMLHASLERLHTSLVEANVKHVFYESPGTAHEWQTWRRDLKHFAPRLFQEGSRSPGKCGSLRREKNRLLRNGTIHPI
jgi:enterochelin esterase family protein